MVLSRSVAELWL